MQPLNCTLVELKYQRFYARVQYHDNSKLYLSGIEIRVITSQPAKSMFSKLYLSGIEILRGR